MAEQLGLDLPGIPALGRDDFLVAPSNALAVALIDAWPDWQGGKLVLTGPRGSGKTHLAHVWAARSGAALLPARHITGADIPALATGPVALEDVPSVAGQRVAETAIFHLHNLALANGQTVLFTGAAPLAYWPLTLPDLKSRLQGAASAELAPPDDTLLTAVLAKLFADRQLAPPARVIQYLLPRIDRSFAAARDIVEQLDRASLGQRRPITRQLARQVLEETS